MNALFPGCCMCNLCSLKILSYFLRRQNSVDNIGLWEKKTLSMSLHHCCPSSLGKLVTISENILFWPQYILQEFSTEYGLVLSQGVCKGERPHRF